MLFLRLTTSLSPLTTTAGCSYATLVFDLQRNEWRKLQGSITYPSQRVNHAACVIEGWAPGNPPRAAIPVVGSNAGTALALPPAPTFGATCGGGGTGATGSSSETDITAFTSKVLAVAPGVTNSDYLNAIYFADFTGADRGSRRSGLIFGGSSMSMCAPDSWTLDLEWRWPGFAGFDENAKTRTDAFLQNETKWSQHRTSDFADTTGTGTGTDADAGAMTYSSSVPNFHVAGTRRTDTVGASADEGRVSRAFQKVKKERAHAEQQISKEASKNQWYKDEVEALTKEVASLKLSLVKAQVVVQPDQQLHNDIKALKAEVIAGKERERGLMEINNEAQQLLVLLGVERLKERLGGNKNSNNNSNSNSNSNSNINSNSSGDVSGSRNNTSSGSRK